MLLPLLPPILLIFILQILLLLLLIILLLILVLLLLTLKIILFYKINSFFPTITNTNIAHTPTSNISLTDIAPTPYVGYTNIVPTLIPTPNTIIASPPTPTHTI